MGKSRSVGNLASENLIYVDIASDRVGIGTTVPSSILDVYGPISINGSKVIDVSGGGAPNINAGVVTATSFVGNLTGTATGLSGTPNITVGFITATGNISVAGTLTYEDVTNVDSVGLITARSGINVTGGSVVVSSGNLSVSGVVTASSFVGTVIGTGATFTSTVSVVPSSDVKALIIDSSNATGDVNPQITLRGNGPNGIDFRDASNTDGLKIVYRTGPNQLLVEDSEDTTSHLKIDRDDGKVELNYGGSKKFETIGAGVTVTGTTFTNQLSVSGVSTVTGLSGVAYAAITSTGISKTIINREYCTVTTAGVTITLPSSPQPGWEVGIAVGNFTDVVVARNGSNIMGLAENFTMDIAYLALQFVYVNSTQGWRYF